MKNKKQVAKKSLLVLGAMTTLSAQFSTELALLAYAAPTVFQATQGDSESSIKKSQLVAIQKEKYLYQLVDLTTESIPTVTLGKGQAGESLKQSFLLSKEEQAHLNFNLTLAGPTDSRVIVKINGITYLDTTVGRGQLAEASFFFVNEGDCLVEIEYIVGEGEIVLESEPWLEFSNMVLTTQATPSRPLVYRVKGETEWKTYDSNQGIEAFIEQESDTLSLEWRYTDQDTDETFDLTIQAPKPHNPLLLLEDDGLFYLNQFNTLINECRELYVRFNNGEWQTYHSGMVLDFVDNECLVDVKAINEYGVESILPTQRYVLPLLKQPNLTQEDGLVTLSSTNIEVLKPTIEYRLNGGEWETYESPFAPVYENGQADLEVRISDSYGRSLEGQSYVLDMSQSVNEGGVVNKGATTVKPSILKIEHYYGAFRTYDTIRFGVWTQTNGGSNIASTEWSTDGVNWNTFSHTVDVQFTTAGDHTLYLRTTNEDGVVSDIYEYPLTVVEAAAPEILELYFEEDELFVGGDYEPYYEIKHEEESTINHFVWGGDYDTMFDSPGEKTITLRVQDSRGLWSNEMSHTFTVQPAQPSSPVVQPSIYQIEHYYGAFRTYDTIRFGVRVQDNGTPAIVSNEWSINGVNWTPFTHTIDVKFVTAGKQALYLRSHYEDGTVSNIYEYPLTITEATAPEISELMFEESDLYVGANFEPTYLIKHEEGTVINHFVWGGDYDTMFDSPGEKTITLKVQDNRGLWSNEASYTFTVREAKAPVIQGVIPSANEYYEGDTIHFDYQVDYDTDASFQTIEWLSGYPLSNQVGTHQVTFRVQDNRGLWSDPFTYTYEVKQLVKPILTFTGSTLTVDHGKTPNFNQGVVLNHGTATNVRYEVVKDSFNSKKLGKQNVKYRVSYEQSGKTHQFEVTRPVEVKAIDPTLTFSKTTLTANYGSSLSYKTGVTVSSGSATDVTYTLVKDSYNPKKLGKQTVKYQLSYTQNGKKCTKTISRTIEVLPVNPTVTFSDTILKVKYGSSLDYKKGVTLSKGSATDVKYSLVKNSFNPKKVGKQTVKYELSYKQNGKKYTKTISRTIEVTAVKPTLTFPKTTLTVKYGKTPDFKAGVKVNKGSATDVKYSVVKGSFNPKKRGTQKVKYQLTYKQSGKSYKTIVERTVKVK